MLASREVGAGTRPVILLHGFLGMGKNLRSLATRWAEVSPERRFLLLDLPGHGQSPPPRADADLGQLARAVLDTADALGLEAPFPVVGHSLGGRVALSAFGVAPHRVEKVVMLDIAPGPIRSEQSASKAILELLKRAPRHVRQRKDMLDFLLSEGLSAPIAQWLLMNVVEKDGAYAWQLDFEALGALHERVNREDLWPLIEAGRASVPLLVVRGSRSTYVSDADVTRLERAGARVETVSSGHDVHVEGLEALVPLLSR